MAVGSTHYVIGEVFAQLSNFTSMISLLPYYSPFYTHNALVVERHSLRFISISSKEWYNTACRQYITSP
jgi:hypothetical protein